MDLTLWLTFFAAAWAISLSPGAAAVASMSAGLSHGFARGQAIAYGLVLGVFTQVVIVAAGVGALIAASATAFSAVKWAGAAYLVWLGIQQWRAPAMRFDAAAAAAPAAPPRRRALALRGWIINALNPKGTVFLLAVVPQFVDPTRPLAPQYTAIGATLMLTELVVMSGYALLAARVLRLLDKPAQMKALNRAFGGLFIAAGVLLAGVRRGA
ncbi:MAG: LysE family transporter [Burkholderiaceae bacterium]|jgi:homoserine/homoserine lactone efflux protein|nr:LysE family transporter [Burkholderiaceae bacterium]